MGTYLDYLSSVAGILQSVFFDASFPLTQCHVLATLPCFSYILWLPVVDEEKKLKRKEVYFVNVGREESDADTDDQEDLGWESVTARQVGARVAVVQLW